MVGVTGRPSRVRMLRHDEAPCRRDQRYFSSTPAAVARFAT